MGRIVPAGALVRDQLDFFVSPGRFQRAQGVVIPSLVAKLFVNNALAVWPLVNGTLIPDSSVSSGSVYFNEIQGAAGFYSVRFFPNQVGFWRLVISDAALSAEAHAEYDVVAAGFFSQSGPSGGLNASFLP